MILGQYLLLKLQIDLCLSNYTIGDYGGACKLCTTPTRDVNRGYIRITSDQLDDASFGGE